MTLVSTASMPPPYFCADGLVHLFNSFWRAVILQAPVDIFRPGRRKYRLRSLQQDSVRGLLHFEARAGWPMPLLANGLRQNDLPFGGDYGGRFGSGHISGRP